MTTPRPPATDDRPDDLKQRYLQASAQENLQPSERVRQAALAHAQMVAAGAPASNAADRAAGTSTSAPQPRPVAANRWNFSLVASVAIAAIGTLLAFQFDRTTPEDKAVVMGTPSVTAPPAPDLPASVQAPSSQPAEPATRSEAIGPASPKPAGAPPVAKSAPQANKEAAKSAPAEALARPAPAPSTSAAELTTQPNPVTESAPATGATQSAPQFARSKSAPITDAKSNSSADAESSAQSSPQQRSAQAGAQPAEGKSRAAPANTPPANTLSANVLALHQAARTGQIAELDRLLQLTGAPLVNTPDDKGRTPLMLATLGGHISLVQRLVSAGADASLKDAEGKTAGQMARQLGLVEISNILNKQPVSQ